MSSIVLPSRGHCIHITDNGQHCQCQWFFPPMSSLLDQNICGLCGHGIHAHTDYVSTVVNHYPGNQCAACVQKTPLMQHCTCEAQIHEHIATDNWYRLPDPWTVLDCFNPDSNSPPSAATSHNATGPFSYTSSPGYNDTILSGDARNMSLTPAPAPSPSPSSTATQFDTTQTRYHSSDGDFARYSDHSPRSPYIGLPEGRAANGSFQYQDYGNPMYVEPPEAEGRSGSYGA